MASLSTVRLNKGDSSSWGFRLQGGKDFGTPLVIQKVNGGSPAERAGLSAGDAVIKINHVDVYNLLHKEAQDVIVRAGPSFEMVIQRGGSTWKPSVVPTGTFPKSSPLISNVTPVTKTSLASSKRDNIGAIGTGHNVAAKPFNTQVNGAVNGGPKLVNNQYNSPLKLYSENAIAETLSAQSEVLSTGALGVNFKKNEKDYDSSNSAVYRMLQEAENDRDTSEQAEPDSGIVTTPNRGMLGLRHVEAPVNRPAPANPQLPPGQNICAECERLIVGVFVRIKDKNLHVECFKCATCGSSLKNVGYYNINNKLYCDIHAKAAAIAINNPSAIPISLSPGNKAPASAISAALSGHSYPTSPLSANKAPSYLPSYPPAEDLTGAPLASDGLSSTTSFNSAPSAQSNIKRSSSNSLFNTSAPLSFSKYINKSSNLSGPKPFSSVSAPLSPGGTLPRTGPLSPQSNYNKAPFSPSAPSYGSYSPSSTEHASEVYHTNISESVTNLDDVCKRLPPPPPPPAVPVYSPINITIPQPSFHTPSQLDSIGSSPRSDYSSHSSSSGQHQKSMDIAKEKIITEINKGLIPKLKRVSLSETQSPRLNYIVSNVNTVNENNVKKVKSELVIPINNSDKNSDSSNKIATENTLLDQLTFTNKTSSQEEFKGNSFETEDVKSKFIPINNSDTNSDSSNKIATENSLLDQLTFTNKTSSQDEFKGNSFETEDVKSKFIPINNSDTNSDSSNKIATENSLHDQLTFTNKTSNQDEFKGNSFETEDVKSKLVIPINNSDTNSDSSNKIATENSLPDQLTFTNKTSSHEEFNGNSFETEDVEDKVKNSTSRPICWKCNTEISRGPFITALGKIWCPNHFICTTPSCRRPLQDLGFVEEKGQLYCEYCFEQYLAPPCAKCHSKIKADCLKAIGKNFHPECFNCVYCGKLFGNTPFFLEDGNPYCDADWNELFTTKCFACGYPVEAGDRWVEALSNNYHSQCFNCTMCKKNLEGQSFFAKGGRPFCKNHAR